MENIKLHNLRYFESDNSVLHINNDTGVPEKVKPNQVVKLFMGYKGKWFIWIPTSVVALAKQFKYFVENQDFMYFKGWGYITPDEIEAVWTKKDYKDKHLFKVKMKHDRNLALLNLKHECEFIRYHAKRYI